MFAEEMHGEGCGSKFPRILYMETHVNYISDNSQHISANKRPANNAQRLPLREHFLETDNKKEFEEIIAVYCEKNRMKQKCTV
jgi:hypothetical protein